MAKLSASERIICAVDTPDLAAAVNLAKALKGQVGFFKLGLEFFTAQGPEGLKKIQELGVPIMLDLKYYDIPNTVAGAVRAASRLGVGMMTMHTGGSTDMMRAAVDAADSVAKETGKPKPKLLGVTVLTSLDDGDMSLLGLKQKTADRVKRLAELAQLNGLDGVVASPRELSLLREQKGKNFRLVTPGIRPAWANEAGDQKRVWTPADAIKEGADYLVIGRPITQAQDPKAAAKRVAEEIAAVL
ncbi:MAG: orotidine-5'-phosphate decarboxylase [Dongiaceae bacterium]